MTSFGGTGLLTSALVGLASTAFAQSATITGTVRSNQGQTLQAANVRIAALNISVGTDANGVYRITLATERVRGQVVTLSVRAIHHKAQSKEITINAGVQDHDFTLEFDANRRSEVAVLQDTARTTILYGDTKRLAFSVNRDGSDPTAFSQHLFPPELIMQNQSRLRITETQRDAILQEINKVQATATQVQWRVAEESEKLNQLLAADAPEAEVIAQAERLMNSESAVKRAQLSMLIRVRNLLTAEQKAVLRDLRRRE